jgi:tRNA-uridine 2-sulfurtransferase
MKAIILLSGGLDSTIAAELMSREGLELHAVNFKTPFCLCDRRASGGGCGNYACKVANSLDIGFQVINASEDFLKVLKKPQYGYGSHMNPCIDCRIIFFRKSKELMQQEGASFIITGEVLGQRPMSQFKRQMGIIEREAGLEGLVVRPLSAKLLSPTIPEKMGWVSREKLLDIAGRSRKRQIAIIKDFGVNDYPCSAGGCLLTDPGFARRVKDLITYESFDIENVELLKTGRHFRLSVAAKLVVGRNENENSVLLHSAKETDYLFRPVDINGPIALGRGIFHYGLIIDAGKVVCRYCDLDGNKKVDIAYEGLSNNEKGVVTVAAMDRKELDIIRI